MFCTVITTFIGFILFNDDKECVTEYLLGAQILMSKSGVAEDYRFNTVNI